MKIKELIEALQGLDPEAEAVVLPTNPGEIGFPVRGIDGETGWVLFDSETGRELPEGYGEECDEG